MNRFIVLAAICLSCFHVSCEVTLEDIQLEDQTDPVAPYPDPVPYPEVAYHGFQNGVSQGIVDNMEINEASGMAASQRYPGLFWVTNDSGDKARIFLIDSTGSHKATVYLGGTVQLDWEDLAVGPGPDPDKRYVYVADIGDNLSIRSQKYIYRFEEPALQLDEEVPDLIIESGIDQISFKMPDGPRDSESILVDPISLDIYLISKREEEVNLYLLSYPQVLSSDELKAQYVRTLPFTRITGADISRNGKEIIIRDYGFAYYWKRNDDETVGEIFDRAGIQGPAIVEWQGESITFGYYGEGYYTVSEAKNDVDPPIMPPLLFFKRKD